MAPCIEEENRVEAEERSTGGRMVEEEVESRLEEEEEEGTDIVDVMSI